MANYYIINEVRNQRKLGVNTIPLGSQLKQKMRTRNKELPKQKSGKSLNIINIMID